jgi:hypothetical protein
MAGWMDGWMDGWMAVRLLCAFSSHVCLAPNTLFSAAMCLRLLTHNRLLVCAACTAGHSNLRKVYRPLYVWGQLSGEPPTLHC